MKKNSRYNQQPNISLFEVLGNIMNKVGVTGFLVLCLVIFIFKFSTTDQKVEIINTWILFKNPFGQNILIGTNLLFFISLIFHNLHYKNKIEILKDRINEIVSEKRNLQETVLKNLNSSK